MSAHGWRPVVSGDDWMRNQERRLTHEERRPRITKAADLLGPGFSSFAVRLLDWDSETARFNGIWYSDPDADNAPEPGVQFLGMTMAARVGHITQIAFSHDDTPARLYVRTVHTHDNAAIDIGAWQLVYPGLPSGAVIFVPTAAATPDGWLPAAFTAPTGLRAIQRA